MNFIEILKNSSKKFNSIVCMGLDPVRELIPEKGSDKDACIKFYENILNRIVQKNIWPGAVKPNYAFYAQFGLGGIEALKKIISLYKQVGIPVILDVKRGDIGSTAEAYAKEAFDFFEADAVTLSPYMGYDSIAPFIESYTDKGCYILTRTSNPGATEIQNILVNDKPLYIYIAERIIKWYKPGIGSVVGATVPQELEAISRIFNESGKEIPLLIPGVGAQGGDATAVIKILSQNGEPSIHRINASRAINYAWQKNEALHYADAAVKALDELNKKLQEPFE